MTKETNYKAKRCPECKRKMERKANGGFFCPFCEYTNKMIAWQRDINKWL